MQTAVEQTHFWFDIVQGTVLYAPQRVLRLIRIDTEVQRMQRSKVVVPCLRVLQRFQHTVADE